jgi:hypothetical protein
VLALAGEWVRTQTNFLHLSFNEPSVAYFYGDGHGAYSQVSVEPVLPPNKTTRLRCESNAIAGANRFVGPIS